jgi:membrane-associated HD superfamily phosphohydrolase
MKNSKSKWLAYTVLVGLIPILSRLLVWSIASNEVVLPFAATDFVAFGLVLHISNINELEHVSAQNKSWKTVQNGVSVIFIALYSVLFAVLLLAEKNPKLVNANSLLICVAMLAVTSFLLSLSILHRLTATVKGTP